MNLHTADLMHRINDYLSRRTPPKNFAADESLKSQQLAEYVNILRRFAPEGDKLNDWWREFMDRLSDESDTWAWPAPKELAKAAKAAGSAVGKAGETWKPDSVAINLERLNKGLPMGEDWLWGAGALRLEAAGANRNTMRERRIQMAEAMAEIYPADQVRARLLELKARHEAARDYAEAKMESRRDVQIPDKRAFAAGELEALVA